MSTTEQETQRVPGDLLTPEEVSNYLGISVGTLYQWRHRKVGPPSIKVGKHLRYRRLAIDAWLDQQAAA